MSAGRENCHSSVSPQGMLILAAVRLYPTHRALGRTQRKFISVNEIIDVFIVYTLPLAVRRINPR